MLVSTMRKCWKQNTNVDSNAEGGVTGGLVKLLAGLYRGEDDTHRPGKTRGVGSSSWKGDTHTDHSKRYIVGEYRFVSCNG